MDDTLYREATNSEIIELAYVSLAVVPVESDQQWLCREPGRDAVYAGAPGWCMIMGDPPHTSLCGEYLLERIGGDDE